MKPAINYQPESGVVFCRQPTQQDILTSLSALSEGNPPVTNGFLWFPSQSVSYAKVWFFLVARLSSLLIELSNSRWFKRSRSSRDTKLMKSGQCGMSGSYLRGWYNDVIKWKHCPRYWPFVRGVHRSPVNSPHKGRWRGALMFSLIYAGLN